MAISTFNSSKYGEFEQIFPQKSFKKILNSFFFFLFPQVEKIHPKKIKDVNTPPPPPPPPPPRKECNITIK